MKKHLLIVLALSVMLLSFSSCGHEHAWSEWTVTTEAACTADGEQTRTCKCGETEKQTIPAKGHTPGAEATCAEAQKCTVCNAELATVEHEFGEWGIVTPATKTENGLRERTCTVCGNINREATPALGSEGLEFTQNDDGTYSVSGIGTCTDTDAVISSIYNGKPVTSIVNRAFFRCGTLTSIAIPDSITSICEEAFYCCNKLTSVTIGDGVTSIGGYAFIGCNSLTKISVSANNAHYCSENGILFNKDKTEFICYPAGKTETSYSVPDSVKSIGEGAFDSCISLTSIVIPDSVTSIGDYVFADCSNLTSVTLGNGVVSMGGYVFAWCSNLTTVTLGNSVTNIGDYAFVYCSNLTSIVILNSAMSIGEGAFGWCNNLTSIVIPDSVTSIGGAAFFSCFSLTDIQFGGTTAQWNSISFGSDWDFYTDNYTVTCIDGTISK